MPNRAATRMKGPIRNTSDLTVSSIRYCQPMFSMVLLGICSKMRMKSEAISFQMNGAMPNSSMNMAIRNTAVERSLLLKTWPSSLAFFSFCWEASNCLFSSPKDERPYACGLWMGVIRFGVMGAQHGTRA